MKSQTQAQIIDRRMREDWETAGSMDAYKRAHDKMIDILETYEPAPLPENVLNTIQSIVEEAEKELVR
jgi:trimethylamine--corrinoid protein Co-methyltransferase